MSNANVTKQMYTICFDTYKKSFLGLVISCNCNTRGRIMDIHTIIPFETSLKVNCFVSNITVAALKIEKNSVLTLFRN